MRKTTSLKIDEELWKQVKKKCIDDDLQISDYIENLILKDLAKAIERQYINKNKQP